MDDLAAFAKLHNPARVSANDACDMMRNLCTYIYCLLPHSLELVDVYIYSFQETRMRDRYGGGGGGGERKCPKHEACHGM